MARFTSKPEIGTRISYKSLSGATWYGEVIETERDFPDCVSVFWFDTRYHTAEPWCRLEPATDGEVVASMLS